MTKAQVKQLNMGREAKLSMEYEILRESSQLP